MRVVFVGCVESSYRMLQKVFAIPVAEVVGVVTRRESSFNSDFKSLEPLAEEKDIPCFIDEGNQQVDVTAWIRSLEPDVGYCFGWSFLLKPEMLSVPSLGFIGYHPAALPRNRGRHPIIWALALGLEETASTFFFMNEGADTGDILSQEEVPIHFGDSARTLYDRLMNVAQDQIAAFTPQLAAGDYSRQPQNDKEANYWRKRSKADGEVDWRMSSRSIYDLVRALTRPYPGAHCVMDGDEVKIWEARVADDDFEDIRHLEPGKVLASDAVRIAVKCGEGVIALTEHEFDKLPEAGDYLQ